jgi:subtilisin family serine protease
MDFTDSGVPGGGPSNQCDNHGTAVAGCVAATINNNQGVVGVAPECSVQAGKIFNEIWFLICLPFLEGQDSWTVNGIMWAADSGARVTNSSWSGPASATITTAFETTKGRGVTHFAAAGNGGGTPVEYPANLASVNGVSAVNSAGNLASFSSYGSGLFISAPGEAILTTDRMGSDGYESGNTATVDGTSFASPYTAGVAALVISADPSLTPDGVAQILSDTAMDLGAPGYDTLYGWGLVNAFDAVSAAIPAEPCPADLDGNGVVDVADFLFLLSAWGTADGDVDGDGDTGVADFLALLAAWGACP